MIYYVSNSGSDTNSGMSASTPWKTLSKVNAATFAPGDQILFQRGSSFYGTLTVKNSGTAGNPITYGAYGTGANPVITGFTTITSGWTNEGNGIYSKVISSDSQTNMVTIDGVSYGMGRYPNTSYLTYESYNSNISITDIGLGDAINWTGAELIKRANDWTWERCKITNHIGDVITYTNSFSSYTGSVGYGYFIQNDLRTLDQFGEWYHDHSGTGKFYMYFGAVNPTTKAVNVATKNNVIINSGRQNILIDSLTVIGSIDSGIDTYTTGSDYVSVLNCNVSFCGANGIYLKSNGGIVNNNVITECNSGAIRVGSDNVTITNNIISNIGLIVGSSNLYYRGIMATASNNSIVENNILQNIGSVGIDVRGTNVSIKNNFINNSMITLNDGGGIYTTGSNAGMVIDGNIITNTIGSLNGGGNILICEGIYLDESANGITVKNNTVAYSSYSGIKLHKAHDNVIQNNTCFANFTGIYILNSTTSTSIVNNVINGNKFIALSGQFALYIKDVRNATPQFGVANNNIYARPYNDSDVIGYYPSSGYVSITLNSWIALTGQDYNSCKSPVIANDIDIQLVLNATSLLSFMPINSPSVNFDGSKKYRNSIQLEAFTSELLIRDYTPTLRYLVANMRRLKHNGKWLVF